MAIFPTVVPVVPPIRSVALGILAAFRIVIEAVMRTSPPDSPAFREAARTLRAINEEITRREQALVEGQKQPEAAKQ